MCGISHFYIRLLKRVFMKNNSQPFAVAIISLALLTYLVKGNFCAIGGNGEAREDLYANENFDEASESGSYKIKRLRNPATGLIPADIREKEIAFAASLPQNNLRSNTWQNRGPYNLGGRTRAIALDVTDENIILAGQVSGGMWRSTDGGNSFAKCTQAQQIHSTTCVVQDRRAGKTNVWYYGTGESYGIVNAAGFSAQFSGNGIFKSTDGGVNWAQLPSTVSNTPTTLAQKRDFDFVWEMVTDQSNAAQDEVYAAVVNGVWRSIDGGTSWSPVLGLDTSASSAISEYTDIAITTDGVLYASISSESPSKGIWRSADGVNWVNITPAGFPVSYSRTEIGIAPGDESQVYFVTQAPGTGSTGHALWKYKYLSGDGSGANGIWSDRTANIPNDHCFGFYTFDFRKYSSQSSYDMFVSVHPSDTNLIFLGGTNIFRNTDGFTSTAYDWIGGYQCDTNQYSNYVYPNHHPDQHKLLFLPSDNSKAISANDGGLMKTENVFAPTVSWQLMNNNYNTGQFYTCAIEPGNTTSEMITGGLQDNGTFFTNTVDYTQPWSKSFYGDGAYCSITRGHTNHYMSWQTGKLFKMDITPSGTVNGLTRIDPVGGTGYQFINPFVMDPLNDDIMYWVGGKFLWRNDSLSSIPITGNEYNPVSQGWKKHTGSATSNFSGAPPISCLDMSEENTNIIYYGTETGKLFRLDSCRTSNTNSRVEITNAVFPVAYVSCVEVDRLNHNNVMVSFSNYGVPSIFYSTDAGVTWTNVSGNLEENANGTGNGPSVAWVHIYNDGSSKTFYAGTSTGLYSTDNLNGLNTVWQQEGASTIGNVVINMIASRTFDNNIVVATHGNGIYSNKTFVPSGINKVREEGLEVNLFPNPSADYTAVELKGELRSEMRIEIFDAAGKLILQSSSVDRKFIWNNGHVSAGTYYLKVNANGKSSVKKVVKL